MYSFPNIRQLRVFLAVADCKSISHATEIVFLSQPAITQAISKLEKSLNTVLFVRKSSGTYLTEAGNVFAERVRKAMQLIVEGIENALEFSGASSVSQAEQLLSLVTTSQLRALVAVCTARNFSLAGRNLNIAQSSLHRSSRDLESSLGFGLFEVVSTGISPSKSAIALTQAVKLGFSEIAQGEEEIFSLQNKDIGHIRVGSMPLARSSILPSSIIEFSESYPDFSISISDGPYNDLLYHLRYADLDFLIGALRYPAPSDDVVQEELFSSELVIVVKPEHPYFSIKDITIDLLIKSLWVLPRAMVPTRDIFEKFFTSQGKPVPSGIVETSSQLLISSLLIGSERLTLISKSQVHRELQEGILAVLPFPMSHASRPIGITMRKRWRPTKTQQRFIDILREEANQLTL